jgi:murein DD-endopeptidase MepM/ murein hydrolase activator NlpD
MAQWSYDSSFRLTSPFGMRIHPITHKPTFHRGVDIVGPSGNCPLYAFVAGECVFAKAGVSGIGMPPEMGIVAAIRDKNGYLHVYAHLSMVSVKVGQHIGKGQMIGRQGTTGSSTGNHLHYEIRKTATPYFGWASDERNVVEPTKYLIDYYKVETPKPKPPVEVKPNVARGCEQDHQVPECSA